MASIDSRKEKYAVLGGTQLKSSKSIRKVAFESIVLRDEGDVQPFNPQKLREDGDHSA